MRLPSPVVLVGRDGNARLMNREYEQRYGPAAIDAASLPQPLAGAGGQVLAMPIRGRDGSIGQAQIMVVGGGQPLLKGVRRLILIKFTCRFGSRSPSGRRKPTYVTKDMPRPRVSLAPDVRNDFRYGGRGGHANSGENHEPAT